MAWSASNAILIVCALSVSTPLVTYTVAVLKCHVDPILPNIATTGDIPPESTLFTQLIVLTTAFVLLVVHIRFVFVASYCVTFNVENVYNRVNVAGIIIGYVMCTGLLLLGCFQGSNSFYVHNISSNGLFLIGACLYVVIQTVLSFRLRRFTQSERTVIARILLNCLIIIFTITYLVGLILSKWECTTADGVKSRWCRQEGWKYHMVGAFSEWILLILYVVYLLTFHKEFRMVKLTATKIHVHHIGGPEEVGT